MEHFTDKFVAVFDREYSENWATEVTPQFCISWKIANLGYNNFS